MVITDQVMEWVCTTYMDIEIQGTDTQDTDNLMVATTVEEIMEYIQVMAQ
jgi:hypothetical protein